MSLQLEATAEAGPSEVHASKALLGLSALCLIARLHRVAADPGTLLHQLGLADSDTFKVADLLLASKHLGLKAKLSKSSSDRLQLNPLPALAVMRTDDGSLRVVI